MSFRTKVLRGPCKEIPGSPFFRSSWERNIYRTFRYMGFTGISYESITFKFPQPYMRVLDYKIDFDFRDREGARRLCEVKGHFDGRSRSRLKGFAKHYPHLVSQMLIITDVNRVMKVGKNKVRAHEWIKENLPGAEIWDYTTIKKAMSKHVCWE